MTTNEGKNGLRKLKIFSGLVFILVFSLIFDFKTPQISIIDILILLTIGLVIYKIRK